MVEFDVKNYEGKLYLKEELQKILQSNPLKAIPNAKAIVVYSSDVSLEQVKKSVELILADLSSRVGESP